MGEYLKYKGEYIKIGTLENLYYTSYGKYIRELEAGKLSNDGGDSPESYLLPDSGFRFRFPFPDEDKLLLGRIIGPYDRGIPIIIKQAAIPNSDAPGPLYQMEIVQQKLSHRESDGKLCLLLVWRDPVTDEKYRIEDEVAIKAILKQIVRNHITLEKDPEKKNFYRQIAVRILKGYRMETPAKSIAQKSKQPLRTLPYTTTKRVKGRGL